MPLLYQVCQQLKADPQTAKIPVIFLSALDEITDKTKAFAVGGADYITKPFQAEEVLARIKHQLMILQQQRQLAERNRQLQHAREVLRASEAQFRHAFDQVMIGIGFVGLDDRWLRVNPALCQLLKTSEAELLATSVSCFLQETDKARWQQCLQQWLEHEGSDCQLKVRLCCSGDRIISVSIRASLMRDDLRQPLYLFVQIEATQ